MKVCIVTGTRFGTEDVWRDRIRDAIRTYDVVIEGGAFGVDRIAGEVARSLNIGLTVVQADWNQHGRAAGPIRNQKMLDELLKYRDTYHECVVAVLAFHDDLANSKGTGDMVRRAKAAGVAVELFA